MTEDEALDLARQLETGEVLPVRVLVSADGTATTPGKALKDYGVRYDVVYVRDDGWTLAAPQALDLVAYALWSDHWLVKVRLPGRLPPAPGHN